MDRFDDMRAKTSKPKLQIKSATPTAKSQTVSPDTGYDGLSQVTVNGDSNLTADNIKSGVSIFGVNGNYGGGSGGSGSTGYNVYVQQSEPESKDGVWIKSSGGNGETKFYEYATATGEFLEASKFNFLKTTEETVAQQIIDGYMYVIARYSSGSYKINLKTHAKTSINTTAFADKGNYYLSPIGSVIYDGKIYVFGTSFTYAKCYCYVYDPATDTSSSITEIGSANGSTNSGYGCYEYDGKALLAWGVSNYPYYAIYDLKNKKMITSYTALISKNYGTSVLGGYGKYVYFFSGNYDGSNSLIQFDMTTYKQTWIDSSFKKQYHIFAKDSEYLYLFNTSTSGSDEYYKYNLTTKTKETIKTQNKYYLYTAVYSLASSTTDYKVNSLMLDDKSGILYFRTNRGLAQPSAMQFTPSPEIDELENGTAVIVQSQYNNVVKMQDGSNIHSGIENAYIKTSDGLKMETTFLGYEEEWKLLANPNGETATVKFNSNGGTSVDSIEVVLGQKILTKPETTRSDNYIFDAWYLGSEPFNFNTQIIKDITLTAHWLEYEEVDYIESTGTQYVDTGFKPMPSTRVAMDFKFENVTTYQQRLFGTEPASAVSNDLIFASYINGSGGIAYAYQNDTGNWKATDVTADTERHIYDMDGANLSYKIDNEEVATLEGDPTNTCPRALLLLANYASNPKAIGKLFNCQIYDDGTLVRNFQPIKIETGTYALIDKVNNKAYFNAGTGSFTGGEYADT